MSDIQVNTENLMVSSGRKLYSRSVNYTRIPLNRFVGATLRKKSYNRGYHQTINAFMTYDIKTAQDVSRIFAAQVQDRFLVRHDPKRSNQKTAFDIALCGLYGSIDVAAAL